MKKGFTLIELILAIGLFAVLSTTVSVMILSTLRNARRTAATNVAKNEGQYAMNDMEQVIKFAKSCSPVGNSSSLTVTRSDDTQVTYSIDASNRIYKSLNNLALTTIATKVSPCSGGVFTCSASTVTICFLIDVVGASDVTNTAGGSSLTGIQFQSQVDLRNAGN